MAVARAESGSLRHPHDFVPAAAPHSITEPLVPQRLPTPTHPTTATPLAAPSGATHCSLSQGRIPPSGPVRSPGRQTMEGAEHDVQHPVCTDITNAGAKPNRLTQAPTTPRWRKPPCACLGGNGPLQLATPARQQPSPPRRDPKDCSSNPCRAAAPPPPGSQAPLSWARTGQPHAFADDAAGVSRGSTQVGAQPGHGAHCGVPWPNRLAPASGLAAGPSESRGAVDGRPSVIHRPGAAHPGGSESAALKAVRCCASSSVATPSTCRDHRRCSTPGARNHP